MATKKKYQKFRVCLIFDLSRGSVADIVRVRRTTTRPKDFVSRARLFGFWSQGKPRAWFAGSRLVAATMEKVK